MLLKSVNKLRFSCSVISIYNGRFGRGQLREREVGAREEI
jgi:hypothetical protein